MEEDLEVHESILGHYATGIEKSRFDTATGRLELERTQHVLRSWLPATGQVLDVGGGPGTYARWLSELGYDVHLFDVAPLHLEQAEEASRTSARPFVVERGDARALPRQDGSADVVLLLGPLYHLVSADDRQRALAEARRVLRPGGLLVAAAIGRLAWLLDATRHNLIVDASVRESVRMSVASGMSTAVPKAESFYAYFHRPSELRDEVQTAGFSITDLVAVEGIGYLLGDLGERMADPAARAALFDVLDQFQQEDGSLETSPHLLIAARRPTADRAATARR